MRSGLEVDLRHKGEMYTFKLIKEQVDGHITYRMILIPKDPSIVSEKPTTEELMFCCSEVIWQLASKEVNRQEANAS